MAALSFFRSGGIPDEQGNNLHSLILIERDARCALVIKVLCFDGNTRAGCISRLFGGEAAKQTGYGFQPVDDRLVTSQKVRVRLKLWQQASGQGEPLLVGLQCLK
jgi:hypothetical protein